MSSGHDQHDPDATRAAPGGVTPGLGGGGPGSLDDDAVLRGCARTEHAGAVRPQLGQIALLERIGKGGMGFVYRGVHVGLDREVAVKVIPPTVVELMPQLGDRFRREARLAAQVESPHIVQVFDVAEDPHSRCLYIVMELIRGFAADEWAARIIDEREDGRVPEIDALDICIAATRGLVVAHAAGIVHRDVKPSNILVPGEDPASAVTAEARLADLGLAYQQARTEELTLHGQAMGTPGFMAPEQVLDAGLVTPAADVFSMGATLYALLTGAAPFASSAGADWRAATMALEYEPLEVARPDVSASIARVITRCLHEDPAKRAASARALLEQLERARGVPVGAEIGRYDVTGSARGDGYSETYGAVQHETGRVVELTILDDPTDLAAVRRMDREARALRRIDHPGVVRLIGLEHCKNSKAMFLVTEPTPPTVLSDLQWTVPGAVPVADTIEIVRQMATALQAVHDAGVIHCCLSGKRMQVDERALGERRDGAVVITTFDLCMIAGEPPITDTVIGVPYFMSPEQFHPAEAPGGLDCRVDVFALGVIAYMFVMGKRPFEGSGPKAVLEQITDHAPPPFEPDGGLRDALWPLVKRMIAPDRNERPATMAEVLEALPAVA